MVPYWIFSVLPGLEIRAALPIALFQGADPLLAFLLSYLLNLTVIPLLFFALSFLTPHVSKLKLWKLYIERLRKKAKKYEKLGLLGLFLFVALPLPGSGVYSGCLLAWILGWDKSKAATSIALGCLVAGLIVLFPTLFMQQYLG